MEKIKSALEKFDAKNCIPVSAMNKIAGGLKDATPETCSNCKPDDCEVEAFAMRTTG